MIPYFPTYVCVSSILRTFARPYFCTALLKCWRVNSHWFRINCSSSRIILLQLHKNQIIHRELNPQNILISAEGVLKIGNIGFSRYLTKTNTTFTLTTAKCLYIAPEQVQGRKSTEKSDIWALGVILYELYYGFPPFDSLTIFGYQMKLHSRSQFQRISDHF